ncbi:MAG TPA: PLD nuclease N-terminal domain-containing protein [Actinomycetales bacterium]|nr:PLD nuclease N-terminal domain-containing protein [Actinomycetales bacterium]
MAKFLVIIELVLLVYCLVDCIQSDPADVRTLPKPIWVLLIIVLPLFGGIGWLLAGKPERGAAAARQVSWPSTRTSGFPEHERPAPPKGPDDDPDFLRSLRETDAEHERTLRQWEDDLRERERRLRDGDQPPDRPTDATS